MEQKRRRSPDALQSCQQEPTFVARLRGGNRGAWSELVHLHRARLSIWARRAGECPDGAEDVVQETFLRAFRGIRAFDGEARLSTWLHRIAKNVLHEDWRRRGRDRGFRSLEELGLASNALFAWLPPDAALDRRDAAARIREALKRLPRRHRAILHARYVEDRSVTEVADTLGISNNYATVLLHRARASFREHAVALRVAPPGDP